MRWHHDGTVFVGRGREIEEIRELLSRQRLVTLYGDGGVGKTRLAVRAALGSADPEDDDHGLRAVYERVALAELGELPMGTSRDLLASAISASLSVRDQSGDPLQVLISHLEKTHVLLVLDNCEHLAELVSDLVDTLLEAAPELHVLATSRRVLGVTAEVDYHVDPLPVPADEEMTDAAELFVARAHAARPGYDCLNAGRWPAVVRLCRKLEGHPGGIVQAASWLRAVGVGDLVEVLDQHGVSMLGTDHLSWSYELCSPPERMMWARASVFPGGFDRRAAEAVCAGDGIAARDVVDLLRRLVDQSVLAPEETDDGTTLWRMLEATRQFGAEQLEQMDSGQFAALRDRHCTYLENLLTAAADDWPTIRQDEWDARLRRELPAIRVSLEWLISSGQGSRALQLCLMLARTRLWSIADTLRNGRDWFRRALRLHTDRDELRVAGLARCAWLCVLLGNRAEVEVLLDEATGIASEIASEELPDLLYAQGAYGALLTNSLDHKTTADLLSRAHRLLENAGDRDMAAIFHVWACALEASPEDADRVTKEFLLHTTEEWARNYAQLIRLVCLWRLGRLEEAASLLPATWVLVQRDRGVRWSSIVSAASAMLLETARGNVTRAAVWEGLADQLVRLTGVPMLDLRGLAEPVRAAREAINAALDEVRHSTAYERGTALANGVDQSIADLDVVSDKLSTRRDEVLTPREREIADLIAQGRRAGQIAKQLVISERTVQKHTEHIMRRLGFENRTQIATWAITHPTSSEEA